MALHEKGVACEHEEVDPFASNVPPDYLRRQPFGRVPVLSHNRFDVYEIAAIARYVDAAFEGPSLVPSEPKALARMAHVVSIVDNYGYRPMVRQVFAHRVFRPLEGERADEAYRAGAIRERETSRGTDGRSVGGRPAQRSRADSTSPAA